MKFKSLCRVSIGVVGGEKRTSKFYVRENGRITFAKTPSKKDIDNWFIENRKQRTLIS